MSYPIGPGPTDTIVQRPDEITVNGSAGPIQIIALSLESTAPVAIPGVGTIPIFVTLAPGFLSSDTGTVSIADVMGVRTFTSTFDVFFDVCSAPGSAGVGCAPGATLVPETMITLSNSGTPWSPTPPPGTVPVTGPVGDILANMHTGLTVGESDFFPEESGAEAAEAEAEEAWSLSSSRTRILAEREGGNGAGALDLGDDASRGWWSQPCRPLAKEEENGARRCVTGASGLAGDRDEFPIASSLSLRAVQPMSLDGPDREPRYG